LETEKNDCLITSHGGVVMKTINVATQFSRTPGGRRKASGKASGEEFRETLLLPHFVDPGNDEKVTVIMDGTAGYGTSFLEEAFGGLARQFGSERCFTKLVIVCEQEPRLVSEIQKYIANCHGNKKA
jgi:hypothetical protein